MIIQQSDYNHRGGGNYGVIVRCPNIVGDRLVYYDHNRDSGSWVIRDFISGHYLSNHDSLLTVVEIEQDADYVEIPPFYNKDNERDWAGYLRLRTMSVFGLRLVAPSGSPNLAAGKWKPL